MVKTKIIALAAVVVLIIAGICAAIVFTDDKDDSYDWPNKDFCGYDIVPVDNLDDGIVAVGQDSFRWVTYFGLASKCVMIDMNDKTNYMGKSFMYVGKAQAMRDNPDLKFTNANCGVTADDVRTIINLDPSVVVVPEGFETDYTNEMNSLRAAGLNIIHIGYIYTFLEEETFEMTDDLVKQIDILSMTFNLQDRGQELKDLIDNTVDDIRNISSQITTKKTGYIGSLAYNGAHGVESSIPYYIPFELAGITNIMSYDTPEIEGSGVKTYSADSIASHMKNDTILFLDTTGIYQCTDNTSIGILQLFEGHDAYVAYPYIWTGINYESVLIAAYQIEHDAYGLLTDVELQNKIDAVYEGFLGESDSLRSETASSTPAPDSGTSIYEDMSNMYQTRRGNPNHGEINIDSDGKITF